jgi:hypothetical protein
MDRCGQALKPVAGENSPVPLPVIVLAWTPEIRVLA